MSTLLANIYLHYVPDLWFDRGFCRQRRSGAEMSRYADDFVVCFEHYAVDGGGQDASVVFDTAELPTIGLVSTPDLDGVVLATGRALLLDPETYARAGWGLQDVWVPPTATSVPTLR